MPVGAEADRRYAEFCINGRIPGADLDWGLQDILIAVVDGLEGLTEAITTVFPKSAVQACIAHPLHNSLDYASWKDMDAMAQALKPIATAVSEPAALAEMEAFEAGL